MQIQQKYACLVQAYARHAALFTTAQAALLDTSVMVSAMTPALLEPTPILIFRNALPAYRLVSSALFQLSIARVASQGCYSIRVIAQILVH